jgi:hypothetical protein
VPVRARVVSGVAGGVLVVGALLPWAEVSAPGGASFAVASMDRANDGWVTLAAGVLVIGLALLGARLWSIVGGVAALAALVVAVQNWTRMRSVIEHAENTLPAPVDGAVGIGLTLTVLAALTIIGVAVWTLMFDRGTHAS